MTLVLLKWNGQMLMKWLSEQFWICCSCIYVLISEMTDAEITANVARYSMSVVNETTHLRHSFIHAEIWVNAHQIM